MTRTASERPQRVRRGPSAWARWSQSWLLALRLARRDIRTHRGRSALIMVLVAAPVLLIAGVATGFSTSEVTTEEELPARLGLGQAEIRAVDPGPIEQLPTGELNSTGGTSVPFGDHRAGDPWTAPQLAALTGGRIVPVSRSTLFTTLDGRLSRVATLALPAGDLPDTGLATLTSGRWPSTADEVLVTERGRGRGLPDQGGLTIRRAEEVTERPVRVVGTAAVPDLGYSGRDLVSVHPADTAAPEGPWLLLRDQPVTWAEVKSWNAYGLVTISRAVVQQPPPRSELSPDLAYPDRANAAALVGTAVLLTVGLLLETSLLAGPAFAVSAVRRRRTLAQLAGNGADRGQLVRVVLAEALILGGGAALLGVALGAAGALAVLAVVDRFEPSATFGPVDLPWLALGGLVVAAVASAVAAAVVPARGATQIAIADVLAGRERSRPVRRVAPTVGLFLVLGAAVVLVGTVLLARTSAYLWLNGLAAAVLVIGTLLLVPALLAALGRWAPRLPLTLRLPVRDAARQRGRSASAVAAVVATAATLTILGVANASDDTDNRARYSTDRTVGHGYVFDEPSAPLDATLTEIRDQRPEWVQIPRRSLGRQEFGSTASVSVVIVPPGCRPEVTLGVGEQRDVDERCMRPGSSSLQAVSLDMVGPGTSVRARDALRRGHLLVTESVPLTEGRLRLAVGRVSGQPSNKVERVLTVPAIVVSADELYDAAQLPRPKPRQPGPYAGLDVTPLSGILTDRAAARLDLPTSVGYVELIDPAGPISRSDQAAVNDRILGTLEVERGYESPLTVLLGALLGVAGVLVLVAALVATALAAEEGRADLATLSALGGPTGLRRRLAAHQALIIAGLGCVVGLAAGLLPGAVFALAFTTDFASIDPATGEPVAGNEGVVVVPWLPLLALLVGVPLLAALVAALTVRRAPRLTRRLT